MICSTTQTPLLPSDCKYGFTIHLLRLEKLHNQRKQLPSKIQYKTPQGKIRIVITEKHYMHHRWLLLDAFNAIPEL